MVKGAGTFPAALSSLANALHPVPFPSSTLGLARDMDMELTLDPLALRAAFAIGIGFPSSSTLTPYFPRLSVLLRNSTCFAENPARGASNEDLIKVPGKGAEMGPLGLRLVTDELAEANVGVFPPPVPAPPKEDNLLENLLIVCPAGLETKDTWLIIPGVVLPETFLPAPTEEALDHPRFLPMVITVPAVDILIKPARSSSGPAEPLLYPRRCCSALPPVSLPTNALKPPPPPPPTPLPLPPTLGPAGRDSASRSKSNLGGGTATS